MTFNIISPGDPGLASPIMQNFRHINYGNNLIPVNTSGSGVDNTLDLGSSSYHWKDIYSKGILYFAGSAGINSSSAIDWDLIDNNSSAFSFDTSGKTGILNINTTNSSEGVTMSGTLGVTGATTLSSTLDVTDTATFATSVTFDPGSTGSNYAIFTSDTATNLLSIRRYPTVEANAYFTLLRVAAPTIVGSALPAESTLAQVIGDGNSNANLEAEIEVVDWYNNKYEIGGAGGYTYDSSQVETSEFNYDVGGTKDKQQFGIRYFMNNASAAGAQTSGKKPFIMDFVQTRTDSHSITAYADNSPYTTVTAAGHTLQAGDYITISGTTNYNNSYRVNSVSGNNYDIETAFVADDATGTGTLTALGAWRALMVEPKVGGAPTDVNVLKLFGDTRVIKDTSLQDVFHVDVTNEVVGIGITAPNTAGKLHVYDSDSSSFVYIQGSTDGSNVSGFEMWDADASDKWGFNHTAANELKLAHYTGAAWTFPMVVSTGNAFTFTGAVGIDADFDINTNKFTVASATGNTDIAGTLGVTGDFDVNTNKFTVAASTGNTDIAGTLGVTGDFDVNTNKFTVAASTGNTYIAGTLGINTTGPDAPLDVLSTAGAQMRNTYTDGSVYSDFTTNSSGYLTISPTGNYVYAQSGGSGSMNFSVKSTNNSTRSILKFETKNSGGTDITGSIELDDADGMFIDADGHKYQFANDSTTPRSILLANAGNAIAPQIELDVSAGGQFALGEKSGTNTTLDLFSIFHSTQGYAGTGVTVWITIKESSGNYEFRQVSFLLERSGDGGDGGSVANSLLSSLGSVTSGSFALSKSSTSLTILQYTVPAAVTHNITGYGIVVH